MMKKEYASPVDLFCTTSYYDSRGRKIGESRPGLFGVVHHYDASGRKVGCSYPSLFGAVKTKFY